MSSSESVPQAVPQSHSLEVWDHQSDAGDSAYGDLESETASVTSSILAGHYENGRRYHAYQSGQYMFPDDEQEQDRLDIKYASLNLVMGGKLCFAPVQDPQQILDLGTGTGIWAIDAGEEYPGATVTATDLSPMQPTWVPPNVKFEIDDAEQPWTWNENFFDLIHMRTMTGCLRNWDRVFEQAFRHTKPGGYIELQEMDYMGVIQPTSKNPGTSFLQWCVSQGEAAQQVGLSLRTSPSLLQERLERAGFIDINIIEFRLPIGPWASKKRLRDAGLLQLSAMLEGIEGLSLRLFTFYTGGWTLDELKILLAKVRAEIKDKDCHAYWPVYVAYARKPGGPPATAPLTTTTPPVSE